MSRSLLKRCWRASPQSLRLLFCAGLCLLRAQRRRRPTPASSPLFVCGAFRSASGLAQGARLYAESCRQRGMQPSLVDITDTMHMNRDCESPETHLTAGSLRRGSGTVIIHANPPHFQLALCALGKDFLRDKRVVGYWSWELETIPSVWKHALKYVDAVEVPSTFVADAIRRWTEKPVTVRPHHVPVPQRSKTEYCRDGILRCLCIFDAGSSWERKNPYAALDAFARAFTPGEAELTFKVSNEDAEPERFARFQAACAATPGVRIITGCLDGKDLAELYLQHDVYLSLHRSEGFGLTILEAMRRGLHVVATGWSGNMDFMTGELAHPVPYTLTPMALSSGPFKGLRARWAEPDVGAAAKILCDIKQKVYSGEPHDGATAHGEARSGLTPSQVATIVLNYNNPQETVACLASLYALSEWPALIVVVDNASTDNSVDVIQKEWARFDEVCQLQEGQEQRFSPSPRAILYKLKANRGYGAGNNAGIRVAQQYNGCHAFWLLNNDTRVAESSLHALCEHYNAGPSRSILGSTIVFLHDYETIQCTAGSRTIGCLGLTFDLNAGKKLDQLSTLNKEEIEGQLNYINGASILIPKIVIQGNGLFKEEFFLYLEDMEYGLRAKKNGIYLRYAPESIVYHREGASTGSTSKHNQTMQKSPYIDYLVLRNRTYIVREYYKYALPFYLATIPLLMLKRLLEGRWRMLPHMVKAIHAGLTSAPLECS